MALAIAALGACSFQPAPPTAQVDASTMPNRDSAVTMPDAKVPGCGFDDTETEDRTYELFDEVQVAWGAARAACTQAGGYLFKIESDGENLAAALIVPNIDVWIGLHDQNGNDMYQWADGSPLMGFTFWGNMNSSENCVTFDGGDGQWDTQSCAATFGYICECELN